jgi:hypothetical protein
VAHVKRAHPQLKKLDNQRTLIVFIGYEVGSKAYRVYDPAAKRMHVTRNMVFDGDVCWD